jgi:hypothetical protein
MRKTLALGAVAAALVPLLAGVAGAGTGVSFARGTPKTFAVYGDAPYGASNDDHQAFDATPAFINAVNHDRQVDLVAHVGDIHSGSQSCTVAYDQSIADLWSAYKDPLVYTPGDNEWSDCQKTKELPGSDSTAIRSSTWRSCASSSSRPPATPSDTMQCR